MLALFRHMNTPGHFSAKNPSATTSASGDSPVAASSSRDRDNWLSGQHIPPTSLATVLVEAAAWTSKSSALMRNASYKSTISNMSDSIRVPGNRLPIHGGNERK
jgi:hypothetical protein